MTQSLDRNAIKESIAKASAKDILYLTTDAAEKSSVKAALSAIEKFLAKGICTITVVRKP